jgi:hypothetical protein
MLFPQRLLKNCELPFRKKSRFSQLLVNGVPANVK